MHLLFFWKGWGLSGGVGGLGGWGGDVGAEGCVGGGKRGRRGEKGRQNFCGEGLGFGGVGKGDIFLSVRIKEILNAKCIVAFLGGLSKGGLYDHVAEGRVLRSSFYARWKCKEFSVRGTLPPMCAGACLALRLLYQTHGDAHIRLLGRDLRIDVHFLIPSRFMASVL